MKILLFILVCTLAVVCSCKKAAAPYYGTVYATVNSVSDTFSSNTLALKDTTAGMYTLSLVGFQSPNGDTAEIGFEIMSPRPITTGTYTTDSTTGNQVSLIYLTGHGASYNGDTATTYNFPTVSITKINAMGAQGSFKGITFYTDSTTLKTTVQVSNGAFNVNFPQQ